MRCHHPDEVGVDRVLAATPQDEQTLLRTREARPYWVWTVESAADLAEIRTQLPAQAHAELGITLSDNGIGTIGEIYPFWTWWIHTGGPTAQEELARHTRMVAWIHELGGVGVRPIILDDSKQIHDGKHRLLAAYEILLAHESARRGTALEWAPQTPTVEVFWNKRP